MNARPAQPDLVDTVGRRWVALAALGGLACALSPVLPLLSIVSWNAVLDGTFPAGVVLTGVALWTTRARPLHPLRAVALVALTALVTWVLMFVGVFLALAYA